MEENFEKKSTKKVGIIIAIIVVLLIVAGVGGFLFLSLNRNPEKIFTKTVEDMFEMTESEAHRSGRIELEMSAELEADDPEIKAVNEFLKVIKLKSITEIDLDKEILNENLIAEYNGEEVINASALIQDETIYLYLKDIYSKYIEVNDYYLEGLDLSTLFEASTETVNEDLINGIKQVLLDEIEDKEFEKEKVELNGKNVQKSTLKLTPKEAAEILVKIFEVVDEHEDIEDLSETIDDMKESLEELSEDAEDDGYFEISLYTSGITNKLVKAELAMIAEEDEMAACIEINKENENEMIIKLLMNEEDAKLSGATEMMEFAIKEEDENNGVITMKMNIEDEGTIALKVKYSVDYDAEIKEAKTSNSIEVDSLTEEDFNEMLANIEDNEILYGLLEMMGAFDTTEDYYYDDYDYEYDYDYDDYNYEDDDWVNDDYYDEEDVVDYNYNYVY